MMFDSFHNCVFVVQESSETLVEGEGGHVAMDTDNAIEEKTESADSVIADEGVTVAKAVKEEKLSADKTSEKSSADKLVEKTSTEKHPEKMDTNTADKVEPSFQMLSNPARVLPQQVMGVKLRCSGGISDDRPLSACH